MAVETDGGRRDHDERLRASRDLDLVRRALSADADALGELGARLARARAIVSAIARRRGSRLAPEEIEDLAQDAVALAWPKLESFAGEAPLESWIFPFCWNVMRNAQRKRGRRGDGTRPSLDGDLVEARDEPPAVDHEHVHQSLEHLDRGSAEIVRRKHFGEQTFEEIARDLSISPNTAKTRYYRALVVLRDHLRHEEVP